MKHFNLIVKSIFSVLLVWIFFSSQVTAQTVSIADGDVSGLITAINAANTNPGADVINLAPGGTYTLTSIDNADNGLPIITSQITIIGNGATIERSSAAGTPDFRIFRIASPTSNLTLDEVIVRHGRSGAGGGILNEGIIILTNSSVTNSRAGYGGGIYNAGMMTLNNSIVRDNSGNGGAYASADGLGGGIYNRGTMILNNSTVSGNTAPGVYWFSPGGGGIFNSNGTMTINSSTINSNTNGGGIVNLEANLTIINSTISGNTSNHGYGGGGILNFSWSLTANTIVTNSTITENKNTWGRGDAIGSGRAYASSPVGSITLKNSVFNASTGIAFYASVLTSLGHNLVNDNSGSLSGPGDLNNTNPMLGPLADNGGPTLTHTPLLGSPVIDAVPLAYGTDANGNPITTDQRGVARPQGASFDIGSVEFNMLHTIITSADANGSITPSGNISVNNGDSQIFTITPNIGYIVEDVLVDGISVGAVTSYTFSNVTADHTISATFKISSYGMKQAAKDKLIPYLTDPNKKIRKAAKKAIKHIDKSHEAKLWEDINHLTKKGKKVFDEEKHAVKDLKDNDNEKDDDEKSKDKKFTPPFSDDALAAINYLLIADKNLAQVAIDDAVAADGKTKEIDKANEEMSKALVELGKNKYTKAIDHYKKAWGHAQKATKEKDDDDKDDESIANNNISLDKINNIPVDFSLNQNYPNPFNPSTVIKYALPEASFVTLKIYNMLGQEIKTLVNSNKNVGTYSVQWNGDNNFGHKVTSGTYIYRVIAGRNVVSKKMILLK